ncbi:MAG: twin-arginine translocase TatA/TatE family subunit [Candidatus Pacebacteria bacterium]|nr:twin-arginine translocase TatA/TatE family subunit [Candidatus Paceibacterota bacterium]
MFGLGISEIIIILLAVGILLFGSNKIVDLARSMGRFTGEFKKGKRDIENEITKAEQENMGGAPVSENDQALTQEDSSTEEVGDTQDKSRS